MLSPELQVIKGCRGLRGNLIDKHAGWRKPQPKQGYFKHSKDDLLLVPKSLGLYVCTRKQTN